MTVTRAASDIRKPPSKAPSCESFSLDCSREHATSKGREMTSYLSPRRQQHKQSGEEYATVTMEKCLLAGAGTNRWCKSCLL